MSKYVLKSPTGSSSLQYLHLGAMPGLFYWETQEEATTFRTATELLNGLIEYAPSLLQSVPGRLDLQIIELTEVPISFVEKVI